MNKLIQLLTLASPLLLSACVNIGTTAGYSERRGDLISEFKVPTAQTLCISLATPYQFKSGDVIFSLPAGTYKGTRRIKSGYFYYAPGLITSSSWVVESSKGVYLDNQMSVGNLFGTLGIDPKGNDDDRPRRTVKLPSSVIALFAKMEKCD